VVKHCTKLELKRHLVVGPWRTLK